MKNVNDMTRDELRAEAKELQIPGRGSMKASELRDAVRSARVVGGSSERLARADRFRDRLARGELVVKTPNGVGARDPEGIPIYS